MEVVEIELADGDLLVIHAMRLRAAYLRGLREGDAMPASVKTKSGRVLTVSEIDQLAAEAERGFDLSTWTPRRGRPPLGATAWAHSPRIAVRVPEDLHRRALERAAREGRSISDVVRELLEAYAPAPGRR